MLLGDINYNLSLGYVLTFLLTMMAVMSMLHAFRNLAHLEIRAGRAEPVFCGETAQFMLHFNNRSKLSRYQLCLVQAGDSFWKNTNTPLQFDAPARQDTEVAFPLRATRRGWLQPGRLTLYTEFPLGLFYCWSYLHFDTRCLVYPKPLERRAAARRHGTGRHRQTQHGRRRGFFRTAQICRRRCPAAHRLESLCARARFAGQAIFHAAR